MKSESVDTMIIWVHCDDLIVVRETVLIFNKYYLCCVKVIYSCIALQILDDCDIQRDIFSNLRDSAPPLEKQYTTSSLKNIDIIFIVNIVWGNQ